MKIVLSTWELKRNPVSGDVSFQKKTPFYKRIEKSLMNVSLTKKILLVLEMIEKSIEMNSNIASMGDKDIG